MPKRNGLKRGQTENPELLHITPLELDTLVDQRVKKALEGEVVFKENDCPEYHYPINDWQPHNRIGGSAWLTFKEIMRVNPAQRPTVRLCRQHRQEGDNLDAVAAEVNDLLEESFYYQLDTLRRVFESLDSRGLNIRLGYPLWRLGTDSPTLPNWNR